MTIVTCPICHSDLVEESKIHDFDCLKCGNEFDREDAIFEYASISQLHSRLLAISPHIRRGLHE
jgi:ribosomal protein L37AE/L43A